MGFWTEGTSANTKDKEVHDDLFVTYSVRVSGCAGTSVSCSCGVDLNEASLCSAPLATNRFNIEKHKDKNYTLQLEL